MRSLGARAVLTVAVLAVLTSCACQVAPRNVRVSPGKVLVVGDSLVVEARSAIEERVPGARVVARTGAAPCSLLADAVAAAGSADVVVLAFSGNDSFLAPCMSGSDQRIAAPTGTATRRTQLASGRRSFGWRSPRCGTTNGRRTACRRATPPRRGQRRGESRSLTQPSGWVATGTSLAPDDKPVSPGRARRRLWRFVRRIGSTCAWPRNTTGDSPDRVARRAVRRE